MTRKAFSGTMVTLMLIVVTLAFDIHPAMAIETIYIRADGSIDPSTAPIMRDGGTYIFTDNIFDSIVVERNDIVINGAGYELQGTGDYLYVGIELSGRRNVTVRNIQVNSWSYGIKLYGSFNNAISGNKITANQMSGILLEGSSNNRLSRNNITGYSPFGIHLYYSSDNSIFGNNVANNDRGIFLRESPNNYIIGNNLTANSQYGIDLGHSANNTIYHNNLIDNGQQVQIWSQHPGEPSYASIWDDGYPSGGNYWSDYTAIYPSAQELDASGIWDTPYIIDESNQDNYPLMEPWTATQPSIVAHFDIDADVLNLKNRGKWITAHIQLPEGYDPADINSSTITLNGTIPSILNPRYGFVKNPSEYLRDCNNDGVLERIVKFDRATLESWICQNVGTQNEISLTVTGKLTDETQFNGTDTINILWQAHRSPSKR